MQDQLGNLLLYSFAIYHLLGGIFSLGPQNWTKKFGEKLYSLDFPEQFGIHYQLTVRSLGAFALFTSIASFLVAYIGGNEIRGAFLLLFGGLFLLRAILRIAQKELFLKAYNITFERSLKNITFNCLLTIVSWYIGLTLIS